MKTSKTLLYISIGFLSLCTFLVSCKKNETDKKTEMVENDLRLLGPEEQKNITSDLDFLIDYYLFDIESFKIAYEKTQSEKIKQFAKEEIAFGEKMIQNIRTYAKKYNYQLDTVVSDKKSNTLYQITNSDVANFDKSFMNTYIDANNVFTDSITYKINKANRADLKEFLVEIKNENVLRIDQIYKMRDNIR